MSNTDPRLSANDPSLAETLVNGVLDAARQNPLSAAAIGMGVAWLFVGGGASGLFGDRIASSTRASFHDMRDRAAGLSGAVSDGVSSGVGMVRQATQSAQEATSGILDQASEAVASGNWVSNVQASGQQTASTTIAALSELFERQPLVLGAIGLAIGSGLAAALPQLPVENEWLGETSDAIKEQASSLLSQGVEQAQAVKDNILQEAQQQGLTVDALKDTLQTTAKKVTEVAGTARSALVEPEH